MSVLAQNPWQRAEKRKKEGAAQPLCHACKACHNHTKGHTVDLQ